ncbi:NYN domain-containing protein [Scleroderma citrinum]
MPVPDKVAIFWDYENCCPPATQGLGYDVVNNIGRMARVFGCVVTFKAYLDISAQQTLKATTFRSELQLSGVSIIDCPHIGRKEVVDKMIMVDMLTFAMDHPPPATVFLITSDRDYAYAVSTLRLRKYRVILITPKVTACLEAQASAVVDWSVALTRLNLTSTIPTPSSKTRTISGGTPVSFGDPIPKTSTAVKPVDTPRLGRKASPPPTLNPFSNGFIPNTDAELMEALGLSDGDHESPPPFQSNLGTTLHDNGRNILPVPVNGDSNVPASAVNAMNCPNLVPPTELPLDEQSSPAASSEGAQLDPEGSSSDVVSTCTSQTSDLSSGSPASAGAAAQLPPNLATRQQIRAKFLPLIQRLLADRSSGMIRSSRSDVAMAVVKADKDAYQRAGTASFRQYSILAQQFGLVVLGGNSANSWIALHPAWFDETMESGLPLGAVKIGSSTMDGQQTKFPTDVGAGCFQPLVDALVRMHRSGFRRPLRSLVGQMLPPKVYQDARVAGFEGYVARATEIHIVQCGGDGSSAWISLHPDRV